MSTDPHASENQIPQNGNQGSDESLLTTKPSLLMRLISYIFPIVLAVSVISYFSGRHFIHKAMTDALPQLDGTLSVPKAGSPLFGLNAPVTVERDAHGVPHLHAGSMDDLVYAQGYVTAQDRLWQMEFLRRYAAGELAAILGPSQPVVDHDRLQRTLQIRTAADRAIAALPSNERHWLEVYARGVNASMAAQHEHLPLEFRVLKFAPGPWSPRDSLLVALSMYQELSTSFPEKLGRESLAAHLSPQLIADLYPTGSWRDHWPGEAPPDLTMPQQDFEEIPLDESQSRLRQPHETTPVAALLAVQRTLGLFHGGCSECVAGSNGWAVAGSRTVSGKPMLSNDMHLNLSVPGLWYEADLESQNPSPIAEFHAAGVTLPGLPFVIVGHNAHVAWGFTNLGGDVQDLYIEHTRGMQAGGTEYQAADGTWQPMRFRREVIHVRNAADVVLDVPISRHGQMETPVISGILPGEKRSLSLRWTIYDPANVHAPFFQINTASDWTSMLAAFADFGGPAQNLMYADDQGHIGYHAVGHIPLRGDSLTPAPLSPVPTDATAPDAASHEWAGYIPFDQLPQAFDPPNGVLVTANGRVTNDGYKYPITLNWMAPYRTERIYKVLDGGPAKGSDRKLTAADMLAMQTDTYSEPDHILAQRFAYAIDHANGHLKNDKNLRQAADILRKWNGRVDANAAAPAIVNAARAVFWPLLLIPKLVPETAPELASGKKLPKDLPVETASTGNLWRAYSWGERTSVEEQMVTNVPARWLPAGYATWDDFLATVVARGLDDASAPRNLATWQQGTAYPLDLEHPIFTGSAMLRSLIGVPTGTGMVSQSGDSTTVKQVGSKFGPSERFTADMGDLDRSTLNLVLGESGHVASQWYMDQFPAWLHGTTFTLPFTPAASHAAATHTLVLTPR